MGSNKGKSKSHLLKKAVIKRLRVPPSWIRSASNLWSSFSSGNCFRDKKKRYLCLIAIIILLIYFSLRWQLVCFKYQSQHVIDRQCEEYTKGEIHGNLCNVFCNSKNRLKEKTSPRDEGNFNTGVLYPLSGCPNSFHTGKDVVFPAILSGDHKVYVKGYLNGENIDRIPLSTDFDRDSEAFTEMIHEYIKDNIGLFATPYTNGDSDILQKLFPDMHLEHEDPADTTSMMKTMWSLVQDDEYVFSRLSQDLQLFPKIYGSCGSLYIVEEVEPLTFESASWGSEISFKSFSKRATVAMAIMDFLEELDTVFEEPIHLCDIKTSHFGISKQGRVKFIDLDATFAKSMLGKTMHQQGSIHEDGGNCTDHSDCNFFDCQGECDKIAGKCRNDVANNNLQVVCEKVFLGKQYLGVGNDLDLLFKGNGFLVSKHANRKLNDLLEKCANPTKSTDKIRLATPNKIKVDLYKALEEIVNFMEETEDT